MYNKTASYQKEVEDVPHGLHPHDRTHRKHNANALAGESDHPDRKDDLGRIELSGIGCRQDDGRVQADQCNGKDDVPVKLSSHDAFISSHL
jgi:hypothetical protein